MSGHIILLALYYCVFFLLFFFLADMSIVQVREDRRMGQIFSALLMGGFFTALHYYLFRNRR